ncbi:MAG: translocation/assembly module TamB [Clostridiales bacterium]|nr:translocation/assembly module TamB [Clostridiales bacterium]
MALLLVIITALYLPPVQDFALKKTLSIVNKDPSMHLEVDRLRLYPPLHLEVEGVDMTQHGDTMIHVGNADVKIALSHIMKGVVGISDIRLDDVVYNMGNPDSVMCIKSSIVSARLSDADVSLGSKTIDINRLDINGTLFSLDMKPTDDAEPDSATASQPLPWTINLNTLTVDSLSYAMSMYPVIDTLTATIPTATIDDISVDLSSQRVNAAAFIVAGLSARYLTPPLVTDDSTYDSVSATTQQPDTLSNEADSTPWTVMVGHIDINAPSAIYGVAGSTPQPGLDMNWLQVNDVHIVVDSLLSRGSELRVPMKRIAATERCGLSMLLTGLFTMNSDSLNATDIHLSTLHSAIDLDAMMGMKNASLPMPLRITGTGYLSPSDASTAMPAITPMLAGLPSSSLLDMNIDIDGENGRYDVKRLSLELPRCFNVRARGTIAGMPQLNTMNGHLTLDGAITNNRWLKPAMAASHLDNTINIPPLAINGDVNINNGRVNGKLAATTHEGKLALDATWVARSEGYDASLKASDFPIQSFMPTIGIENITATATVDGQGYDVFRKSTSAHATVDIHNIIYNKRQLADISLVAAVDSGNARISMTSDNRLANFDLRADGNLANSPYDWTFSGDLANLDLKALGMSDSTMYGSANINGNVNMELQPRKLVNAALDINSLDWHIGDGHLATTGIKMHLAVDSTTGVTIDNRDLTMSLKSPWPLDSILDHMPMTTAAIDSMMAHNDINVDMLQRALPRISLDLSAGQNNVVSSYLNSLGMGIRSVELEATNDSLIKMNAHVLGFNSGTTVLDTITARVYQKGKALYYRFHLGNRPGTLDQWASVSANGMAGGNRASILFKQQNIDGDIGYRLGFIARWLPDKIKVRVVPSHPIIGYKEWTVNDSNFVSIDMAHKHLDADLAMNSAESSIHLFTSHSEHTDSIQEDLNLKITDIKLAEWVALNPFAPPINGDLSADMRFGWNDSSIDGNGTISLTDLYYNKQRVGSFDLGVELETAKGGPTRADVSLMVDSIKTITASGALNDSTARNPFLLDFKMIHFPLNILNPFLPKDMAQFSGSLNGTMDITGSLAQPQFDGFLNFDSTNLKIPMFGTTYTFSNEKIAMDSNIITFNNFKITGANQNPLLFNGTVDARHLTDIMLDLNATARNMQVVGSKKKRGVQVYGKAFIDLDASVKGPLSRFAIDADLSVLENTNVTYIVTSATDNLTSRSNNSMVKFVNFADTTVVAMADSVPTSSMLMSINATLNVRQGSTIGVDLSTDGKNRVQLQAAGTLNYDMSYMGDSRLTGRLNLNQGYVRYTPPFMSEKLFNFKEGSYISFNGNMMNPYLSIKAVDVLRANVQQDGQNSRLINFDVILSVTNSLDNMNVAFDLATNDDITVANELQSMSAEQRANQAMNLLLYNVYTGPGTKASSSLNGNPLYSFLESQVNSWAARNIKGVNLSFGIDQYDRTVNGNSSTTTSYSYKMSKSLFNDRFKISIGGNYASDADANQNVAQNLINDISFEYDITPSGSMYIKIFRHTGYESILEGEITQTGVGFVYKRKLRRLSDLFKPLYRRRKVVTGQQNVDGSLQEQTIDPTK